MNQVRQRAVMRTSAEPQLLLSDSRIVPFDQLVTFDLTGNRNNVLIKVINISVEGHFVAVAMSYSVLPEVQIVFGPDPGHIPQVDGKKVVDLKQINFEAVLAGFRQRIKELQLPTAKAVRLENQLLQLGIQLNPRMVQFGPFIPVDQLNRLFQVVAFQEEINFLYSIFDSASDREFQSESIHNLAGLGRADGDRPFRFLPQPIIFEPRSVIRVQITEVTGKGRLYFVLQGYKVLGSRP